MGLAAKTPRRQVRRAAHKAARASHQCGELKWSKARCLATASPDHVLRSGRISSQGIAGAPGISMVGQRGRTMPITDLQAYTELTTHPKTFLKRYPLWIYGQATAPTSQTRAFQIGDASAFLNGPVHRPDSFFKTFKMRETQAFMVSPQGTGMGGVPAQASWLAMSEWDGPPSINNISVLTLDTQGPSLMFTANLTGCAVAMSDLGNGRIAIAHVRPNAEMANPPKGALDGEGLNTLLSKSGWTAVYGRSDYLPTRQVVIVGVRRNNHWKLYAQKQSMPGAGAGDVLSVHRIFG